MFSFAWKWKLAGALSAAAFSMAAVAADFDGMVTVGPNQLQVVQAGEGAYTVVFEAGFASDLSVWRKVTPEIAKKAGVLVYSRAGYGKSPARAQPLTMEQSVAELAAVLEQRKVQGPLILVGHSYGGFLIRYFAVTHPQRVAGLVLVDPADEGLESVLRGIDAVRLQQDQQMLVSAIPPKWQADLQAIQKLLDAAQLPAMPALPDVPAVLITSVRARAGSDFLQETADIIKIKIKRKRQRHAAFINRFSNGAHVFTANSGHGIQMRHAGGAVSFRQRAAIPPLLLAVRDPQPVVRQLALWGLSEMRFPETAAAVAAMLADPDARVRAEAAGALGDMGETRWLAPMIAMLSDGDPVVRRRAAHALGDLRASAAIPMLQRRLNDPESTVVSEARWALAEMR